MVSLNKSEIQALKQRVGEIPFIERIDVSVDGFAKCPFHDGDSGKSFHLHATEDASAIGTCFSECAPPDKNAQTWDALAFVMQFDKVDFPTAVKTLQAIDPDTTTAPRVSLPKHKEAKPMTAKQWEKCGRAVTDEDAAVFAASRPHSASPSAKALNALGCKVVQTGPDILSLATPYRMDERFLTLKMRHLTGKAFWQENSVSSRGLFNINAVNAGCDVFVVEGEPDVGVLLDSGYTAVSVMNAAQREFDPEALAKLATARSITLIGDNDPAGIACMDALEKLLPQEKVHRMRLPAWLGKDMGEIRQRWGPTYTFRLFFEAQREAIVDECPVWERLTGWGQLSDEPIRWTIEKLLPYSGLLLISGNFGAMKSVTTMALAGAIASGSPVFGRKVLRPLPVMYLDRENPLATVRERARNLDVPDDNPRFWGNWDTQMPADLNDPQLVNFMAKKKGVLIFDSLADWLDGADENSPSAMNPIMQKFLRLARLGAGVIVLHHTSKANKQAARGTTAIVAGVDMALNIEKDESGILYLSPEKFRMCADWDMQVKFSFQHNPANPEETIGITYHVLADGLKMGGMTGRPKSKVTDDPKPMGRPPKKTNPKPAGELVRDTLAAYLRKHRVPELSKNRLESVLCEKHGTSRQAARDSMDEALERGLIDTVSGKRGAIMCVLPEETSATDKAEGPLFEHQESVV